jgi:hypothetical protein
MNLRHEYGPDEVARAIGTRLAQEYASVAAGTLPDRLKRAVEALDDRMGRAAEADVKATEEGGAKPR